MEIAALYEGGLNTRMIAEREGLSVPSVTWLLRRAKAPMRPHGTVYTVDHAYFDRIDTEPKAYWAGMMASDGCVHGSRIQLILHERDVSHIDAFRKALGSTHPVMSRVAPIGTTHRGLVLTSAQLAAGLARVGITPRKSLTIHWPELRDDLYPHFLRGVFDGDGSVSFREPYFWVVCVSGSSPMIPEIQEYLMRALALRRTRLLVGPTGCRTLSVGGTRQVRRFAHLLYDGATVWLPRKRARLEPLLLTSEPPPGRGTTRARPPSLR